MNTSHTFNYIRSFKNFSVTKDALETARPAAEREAIPATEIIDRGCVSRIYKEGRQSSKKSRKGAKAKAGARRSTQLGGTMPRVGGTAVRRAGEVRLPHQTGKEGRLRVSSVDSGGFGAGRTRTQQKGPLRC